MEREATPPSRHPLDNDPIDEEERLARNPSRVVLPAVPPALSEAFCLLNCFSPGLGTFFSSVSCCCARTRGMSKTEIAASVFVGMFIALLQLLLTPFLLVGWVWSCFWGILLTAQSDVYFKPPSEQDRTHRSILQNPLSVSSNAQTHPEPPPPYTFYDDHFQRGVSPPPPYSYGPPPNAGPPEVTSSVVQQPTRASNVAHHNDSSRSGSNLHRADELPLARIHTNRSDLDRPSSAPLARVHFVSESQNGQSNPVNPVTTPRSNVSTNQPNGLPDVG